MRQFRPGDKVRVFAKSYVRGTRRPGFNGQFRFRFSNEGILLSKSDPRAWADSPYHAGMTADELHAWMTKHVGFANATGAAGDDGLTDKNNPVLVGHYVQWLDRDQIR
jgi:hypothetical protein